MFQVIAIPVVILLYIGVAWVIFKDYRRTRNIGFLIVGCGILVWPQIGGLLMNMVRQSLPQLTVYSNGNVSNQVTPGWVFAVSIYTYQAIHAGLILIGLLVIGRSIITYPGGIDNANPRPTN